MIAICLLLILASIKAEELESTEDIQQNQNVTTLYPVSNKTDLYTNSTSSKNESEYRTVKEKSKTDATTWKLEAAYAETNLDTEQDGNTTKAEEKAREEKKNDTKEFKPSQPLGSFFDEEALAPRGTESYEPFTQVFKHPDTSFMSFPKEEYYITNEEIPKEVHHDTQVTTDFPYKFEKTVYTRVKDAWPLGILESKPTVEVPVKIPCNYEKPDYHNPQEHFRPQSFYDHSGMKEIHEVYETPVVSHSYHEHPRVQETHMFHAVPNDSGGPELHAISEVHKIPGFYGNAEGNRPGHSDMPAGGLYKFPDPFKPEVGDVSAGHYKWETNGDAVENHMKKRENPLQNLLRMITAFLPVGLIISALTPSVITIHNTDNGNLQPSNLYRRSDTGVSDLAPISERCRRRLLCELHSDANYGSPPQKRKVKHCYKIYCEDTQALWRLLHWIITRHKSQTKDNRARDST